MITLLKNGRVYDPAHHKNGVVEDNVVYLSAMEETKYTIAQANTKVDKKGKITDYKNYDEE